jgi:hypothetical protein
MERFILTVQRESAEGKVDRKVEGPNSYADSHNLSWNSGTEGSQ